MRVTRIICDHCGAEISEAHPIRFSVERFVEPEKTIPHYNRPSRYASTLKLYLCGKCLKEAGKFFGTQFDNA